MPSGVRVRVPVAARKEKIISLLIGIFLVMITHIDGMINMLKSAEPVIAPILASNDPAIKQKITVQNSGKELPTASNVAPLILGDILYFFPTFSVPFERIFEKYHVVYVVIIIIIIFNNIFNNIFFLHL